MKKALLAVAFLVLSCSFTPAQTLQINGLNDFTEATTRAYPNGGVLLSWYFDTALESEIDGFWIYRSPKKGNNLDGMLGTFSRVATINKSERGFNLSAPVGTYVYFLVSYKGTLHSTASNQISVVYTP